MATLLPEILLMVFEHAWVRDFGSTKRLLDYCLVCSSWRPIAQRLLFTDVVLSTPQVANTFIQAVQANRILGRYPKILRFWPPIAKELGKNGVHLIHEVTSVCSQVYLIVGSLPTSIPVHHLLNLVSPYTFRTLKALVLYFNSHVKIRSTLHNLLHFLSNFINLSHLTLLEVSSFYKPATTLETPPPSPPFDLYEFNWKSSQPGDPVLFQSLTNWLFNSTKSHNLRIFGFEDKEPKLHPLCVDFLRRHGSALQSLRWWIEPPGSDDNIVIKEICPNLRELVLPLTTLTDSLRATIPTAELEYLHFQERDLESEESNKAWIAWIIKLPRIRHISYSRVVLSNSASSNPNYWRECSSRGIEVDIVPLSMFYTMASEDAIPVSHFPRGKTIANLSKMSIPVDAIQDQTESRHFN
ncbi:hypothetical protein FRC02_011922 [Tulasnella sp. 418]|nr:hypothetical protein FRC02_011922 [Tulasnella sp. 418]